MRLWKWLEESEPTPRLYFYGFWILLLANALNALVFWLEVIV